MQWDDDKLNRLMKHFGVTANQIANATGIPTKTTYNLKKGAYNFDKFHSRLTAYMEALKKARKAELESMIAYYENFEP